MDLEKILADLPEPLEEALYVIVKRLDDSDIATEIDYATACAVLRVFYEQNSLKESTTIRMDEPTHGVMGEIWGRPKPDQSIQRAETEREREYLGYKRDIARRWTQWKAKEAADILARSQQESFGYAILTKDEKELIHTHLGKVREIVERSSLSDRKKNKLFERISKLASETDRNGTYTDRFFAFMGDLAFTSGDMAQDAKPALHEFREILKIIMKSREKAEGAKLPKPEDFPQLPPPTD